MEQNQRNGFSAIISILLRVMQGIIIGAGAILPGISGGVLCVTFGIYQPMMAFLAKPLKNFPKHWKLLVPIGIGLALGFVGLAGLIANLLERNSTITTSLFIGLIAGTFPSLLKEGAKQGRTKGMWIALAFSTATLLVFFSILKHSPQTTLTPSFGWFIFCGVLWGISLIVPGMSSSSVLLFFGLYKPLSAGIASLDLAVLIPFSIGILATVSLLARLVSHLFEHHHGIAFYSVIGFVIASTIPIIPLSFASFGETALCLATAALGFRAHTLWSTVTKSTRQPKRNKIHEVYFFKQYNLL